MSSPPGEHGGGTQLTAPGVLDALGDYLGPECLNALALTCTTLRDVVCKSLRRTLDLRGRRLLDEQGDGIAYAARLFASWKRCSGVMLGEYSCNSSRRPKNTGDGAIMAFIEALPAAARARLVRLECGVGEVWSEDAFALTRASILCLATLLPGLRRLELALDAKAYSCQEAWSSVSTLAGLEDLRVAVDRFQPGESWFSLQPVSVLSRLTALVALGYNADPCVRSGA